MDSMGGFDAPMDMNGGGYGGGGGGASYNGGGGGGASSQYGGGGQEMYGGGYWDAAWTDFRFDKIAFVALCKLILMRYKAKF